MRIDREYHHFKGEHLTRSEWVERFVVDELVATNVSDADRESSQAWELMHSSTCKAFMHVLAEKRGVDVELARVAGALHDYYVVKTGKYKNHARLGATLVREVLANQGGFSESEIEFVCEMVGNHSDKHIHSDSPHVELVKDADVFDCSLYYGTEFYYLTRKPLPVCHEYFRRVLRVRQELAMPLPAAYQCLSQEDNGSLEEMGDPAAVARGMWTPTTAMLALWSLSSSPEAKNWPLIVVRNQAGMLRWYGPTNSRETTRNDGLLGWDAIRKLRQSSAKRLEDGMAPAQDGKVRELLNGFRGILVPAWGGFGVTGCVREQAAVALRDFECDPKADAKLESMVAQRAAARLERGEHAADAVPLSGWELDPAQEAAVDQLARIHALANVRGDIVRRSNRLLVSASERLGRDLLFRFPSDAFDCEESPQVQGHEDAWLAVAWPRFERFEFLVGDEAEDRFAALTEYFGNAEAAG